MTSTEETQVLLQAGETLRASEARYRALFELSPISMWEEDFSEVKTFLDNLRRQGVTDLEAHLAANPAVVHEAMRRIKILDVNQATLKLFGAQTKEALLDNVSLVLGPATYPLIVAELLAIDRGAAEFEGLGFNYKLSGEPIEVALHWLIPGGQARNLTRLVVTVQDVTQPRRAEAALRESEARYRALFELSPISMWEEDFSEVKTFLADLRRQGVTDLEAHLTANPAVVHEARRRIRILDVNQATLKLFGAKTKEALLDRMSLVLGPGNIPLNVAELLAIDQGAAEFDGLSINYKLSGEPIEVALRWLDPGGQARNLSRLVVTVQDVTQPRRAEAALRESEARFRAYIEHSPEGIFVVDTAGRYRDANPAACALLGYTRDELLSLTVSDMVSPDDAVQGTRFAQLLAMGAFSGELPLRRKDGARVPVSLNAVKLPDGNYLGFCTDITGRLRAEEELRASEERYRVLAESLPDMIFILNRQHRVSYVNAAAARMQERPPEALVGLSQAELFPAETAQRHAQDVDQVFATGQAVTTEYLMPLADMIAWVDTRLTPLRDAAGEIVAVLGISRDVTERKAMEEELHGERASLARRVAERTAELNAANTELVRAMRAKDDFLATMSHELRTPLTGILGLSESLLMGTYGTLSDTQIRPLRMLQASGEHLLALITDVLDLAKIGAEKLELQAEWVPTLEVCQASLRLVHPQADKKNIRVSFQLDDSIKYIRADARRFKQMLLNLLGNAVKFTPEGGAIGLQVAADAERARALFTVWDTGIGISADDLQRLFQPFMQVDNSLSRRYEGAGLGLALVRQLAELHGGGVQAESREGQGSRFTIVLPWNPAERPSGEIEPGPAGARRPGTAPLPQAPEALILLAEDNDLLMRTLADTLRAKGYAVLAARDGLEALDLAGLHRPALVLMDIQMPKMDGLEAIRRLRADPALSRTPVIALTALTMPGDRERCLAAGANDYVSKPIRWSELLRKMHDLLQG